MANHAQEKISYFDQRVIALKDRARMIRSHIMIFTHIPNVRISFGKDIRDAMLDTVRTHLQTIDETFSETTWTIEAMDTYRQKNEEIYSKWVGVYEAFGYSDYINMS